MDDGKMTPKTVVNGFSPVSSAPVFWKSRKRSVSAKNLNKDITDDVKISENKEGENKDDEIKDNELNDEKMEESTPPVVLSEKRKALFEPLEPIMDLNGRRPTAESILPPPDFDSANYPRGWLIGKKRKLVNVDVVESMRRIAVQEMNRKDREINGLNEQLDEDSRVLEHLQLQLLDERSKRAEVERQNALLQNQVDMLMNMLQDPEHIDDDDDGSQEPATNFKPEQVSSCRLALGLLQSINKWCTRKQVMQVQLAGSGEKIAVCDLLWGEVITPSKTMVLYHQKWALLYQTGYVEFNSEMDNEQVH
ncbi:hypothetical protein QVD17_02551 [Tagetes erecta]|uniref:Uncharacterized protein n=1 Tax=Tagetes erecta TaxID=13708 RepID=A0AAD8L6T3_TARER|nr:hypothetical protein QVD17_02551 [Tagetes erecta]